MSQLGQSRHSKGAVVTSDLHPTPDITLHRNEPNEPPGRAQEETSGSPYVGSFV